MVVGGQTCRSPLTPTSPIPRSIEPPVAFADDQARVEHFPFSIVPGFAARVTVGAAAGLGCFASQQGIVLARRASAALSAAAKYSSAFSWCSAASWRGGGGVALAAGGVPRGAA